MADLTEKTVRTIVREEIAASPVIVKMQSQLGILNTDVLGLKTNASDLITEQRHQGVLLENMESKMDAVLELLTDNLKVTQKVSVHDERLQKLEADNDMVKSTVTLHSGQLARLGA